LLINKNKNKNVTTGRFARVDEPWETAIDDWLLHLLSIFSHAAKLCGALTAVLKTVDVS